MSLAGRGPRLSMASILPPAGELLGLILQTLLYGAYLILYVASLYFLYGGNFDTKRRGRKSPNKAVLLGGIALLLTATPQWIIQVVRVWTAFINHADTPNGPLLYLSDLRAPLSIARLSLYVVEVFVSDLILIARLWIVWGRDWRIAAAPVLTWVGLVVCGCMYTYEISRLPPGVNFFRSSSANWVAAGLALTLFTNFYCTGLLSWKIWSSQRAVQRALSGGYKPSTARRILATLIESAALYSVASLIIVIAYFAQSFASFTCISLMAPLVGISYCLIIVRYGMDGAFRNTAPISSVRFSPQTENAGNSTSHSTAEESYAIKTFSTGGVTQTHDMGEPCLDGKPDSEHTAV
ncbi:uncharacterized protein PHACADRAFT_203573 [Phanerochaete carnosa HHB-10118-sp]|uniref:Uncharacterized protein n=1 Tax=Phanerochaete carnosa (strain HHB-10118-sp) TaxID=650164 RepID=K5WLS5_PHACS|nr:uncharacterized protein PHACADRAFT_203573 [Phanerochaete carnosa HHB-10118-sp]EKM60360.1 hypothetical protein PHACADRAFT_203573 [Phanerochaete carnosa HHB-10118-sp]